MVSKLIFKGEKKKSRKNRVQKHEWQQTADSNKTSNSTFAINGKEVKIDDIDLAAITNGWTTAYPIDIQAANSSILDTQSGNLPIIITYADDSRNMCLMRGKLSSSENASIKKKLIFSDDVELSTLENTIIYTPEGITVEADINRIEPTNVNEVFLLSDVSTLFKNTDKIIGNEHSNGVYNSRTPVYSLKTADGEYLTSDPSSNELMLSMTLTENGLFSLNFEMLGMTPYCRILVGKTNSNTMMITKSGDLKVIPDPEDVLGSLSRFIIRIRKQDAHRTKEILKAAKENSRSGDSDRDETAEKVKKTALDLSKLGFKINNKTLNEISKAYAEGWINEWVVDFKEKNIHDRRA